MIKHIHIALEGAYNLRDIGGYEAAFGRRVKTGLLYRADELNRLTDADIARLEALGIKTYVDFRSKWEVDKSKDRIPATLENQYFLNIDFASIVSLKDAGQEGMTAKIMEDINRRLVADAQAQYAQFFRIVSKAATTPLLYHCTAGKDRTGIATALLLSALGVDRETIYADYLLSSSYLEPKFRQLLIERPELAPAFDIRKEYLQAGFDYIEEHYGHVDSYLAKALGVDVGLLKSLYLE